MTINIDDPNLMVLKRVPEQSPNTALTLADLPFVAAIIDLETMGLDANVDEIIELGMLCFGFDKDDHLGQCHFCYNGLQQPSKPIPQEITRITGIRDQDVRGQQIDWPLVARQLQRVDLILCHNSQFDRNFLEKQTPNNIQTLVIDKPFGCTVKDIDWQARGFESAKLDYLNFKLGYFYDGHRALNDCFATLNLLQQSQGAFTELKDKVKRKQVLLVAEHAPFDSKDRLKQRGYRWSDGQGNLAKGWWCLVDQTQLAEEQIWLDEVIYQRSGVARSLPQTVVTAKQRYSTRVSGVQSRYNPMTSGTKIRA